MSVELSLLKDAIHVENLTKDYKGLRALDQISFQVRVGSVFGLLGPNGAGKTTTIRILTGLTRPSSGHASVLGFDVAREALKAKQRIGVVPETSNVYEELTATQNLVFAAQLYGVPRTERKPRVRELLETFGLLERAENRVDEFSRGMKRRLTIACALVHKPELLFLDEPTTGLDVQSARQLRAMVSRLRNEGVTVFLTTHYIEEADQLCDKVAMINRGKIVALDSPEALKASVTGTRVVEVIFTGHPAERELELIPGVHEVYRLGDRYRLTVAGETDIVGALVNYGNRRELMIQSLNVLKPSLEDAFLRITGSTPGEDQGDKTHSTRRVG
jgi:ABC-2 type transport system ATP-binding protein